ncbi:MAG: hypothetical protein AB7Q45_27460, partial [Planctomycetaceae bacterium]
VFVTSGKWQSGQESELGGGMVPTGLGRQIHGLNGDPFSPSVREGPWIAQSPIDLLCRINLPLCHILSRDHL